MKDKVIDFLNRLEALLLGISIEPLKKFFDRFDFSRFTSKEFSRKFIAIGFAILLLCLSALSAITVISEKVGKADDVTTTEETTLSEETTISSENADFKGNFLLCLMNDEETDISMLCVLSVDTEAEEAKFHYINKNAIVKIDGFSGSFLEHYSKGGTNELLWAVGEHTGLHIDRYITGSDSEFTSYIGSFGKMNVTVNENIEHTYSGIGYIIEKGTEELTADMFVKYLVYICAKDDTKLLTELLTLTGATIFGVDGDRLMSECERLIGTFDTNITALDFGTYKNALSKLAFNIDNVKISVATNSLELQK